ncbi:MAG: sigma-70 family RNA polymerase sigma factor, partial [Crocinitomicaceae bacterium]|nr:sigma-70 family RNA polymerase sigma factor [Crocinitomicaceae bacterium]
MLPSSKKDFTEALIHFNPADHEDANRLFPLVYDQLKSIAKVYVSRENPNNTIDVTDLVHEAYFKMVDQKRVDWKGKTHFFAVGATAMRRILVDHARSKKRVKRGGDKIKVDLDEGRAISVNNDEHVLVIDDAIKELEKVDKRQADIIELRFFSGMTVQEV